MINKKFIVILDIIYELLKDTRDSAQNLDGNIKEVKHIRTCIFSAMDAINKLIRLIEMYSDENIVRLEDNNG